MYLCMPLNVPGNHISYHNNEFTIDKGFENHPVVMVSWFGAYGGMPNFTYRLPTEAEWTKAARGTDQRAYPWGDEIDDKTVNYTHSTKSLNQCWGRRWCVLHRWTFLYNGKNIMSCKPATTAALMVFTIWPEMCAMRADDYPRVHYKFMRGGSFSNYAHFVTTLARNSSHPEYCSFNVGFKSARCDRLLIGYWHLPANIRRHVTGNFFKN